MLILRRKDGLVISLTECKHSSVTEHGCQAKRRKYLEPLTGFSIALLRKESKSPFQSVRVQAPDRCENSLCLFFSVLLNYNKLNITLQYKIKPLCGGHYGKHVFYK